MGTAPTRRSLALAAAIALAALVVGSAPAQATVAATASVTPRVQYVGDTAGTTFTFKVKNSSTALESVGSVRIIRPGTQWTITACPTAPAGWTSVVAAGSCTFNSPAGATGNIAHGATGTFTVTATTAAGSTDVTGLAWSAKVDVDDTFNGGTNSAAATAATAGALGTTLYVWQITSAVLQPTVATAGANCPKANKIAIQNAPMELVICGRNHANTALTPAFANSSLAGTMFDATGGLFSGSVAAQSTRNVVLGTWSVTITQDIRDGKTVIAGIGSSSTQTSLSKTLANYVSDGWPMFGRDLAHSGDNAIDTTINLTNVHSLVEKWQATTGMAIESSPVVAKGNVYVGSDDGTLYAYDAVGMSHCSGGPPAQCTPIFTAPTTGRPQTAPAVDGGMVVVSTGSELDAFSAFGSLNCSGSPPSCTPIWEATSLINGRAPMPYAGLMFTGSASGVYQAIGFSSTSNCTSASPPVCSPSWFGGAGTDTSNAVGSPAISATTGDVYIGSMGDALGAWYSGTAKASPLWRGNLAAWAGSSPTLGNGDVYIGGTDGVLYAFDASGVSGCAAGTPNMCQPLWTAQTGGSITATPAIANGVLYVGSTTGTLYAYDANGVTNCNSTTHVCQPLWTAPLPGIYASPIVANGVLYVADGSGDVSAFDAAGNTNCSGSPKTCTALWTGHTGGFIDASPALVAGRLYVGSEDDKLHVFGLP